MLFSQLQKVLETVSQLDADNILAFRPLIHDAELMHRAAEALATAFIKHYEEDPYRGGLLNIGDLFTSLAYIWDFSFDFPGISIWSVLNASAALQHCTWIDDATTLLLSAIPLDSCGIDFNEQHTTVGSPLMYAVDAKVGPKTVSTMIRLGAKFSISDHPKIMPTIVSCQNLQTMRELILLASKMRIIADVSQPIDDNGSTALHICCGDYERVKLLLDFGVCPLRRDANGSSARQCVQIRMAMLQLHFTADKRDGSYVADLKKLRLCYNALLHAEKESMKKTIYLV
jgi:hypothetical protein